ncbi:coiled-coil domain-containing protein 107, partial [Paroedura picta]|uniref:coiled-coil domain-containing protein 107 n=1 Tax=Paroedura picta TaxID=143630 RepID=UPI0040574D1E
RTAGLSFEAQLETAPRRRKQGRGDWHSSRLGDAPGLLRRERALRGQGRKEDAAPVRSAPPPLGVASSVKRAGPAAQAQSPRGGREAGGRAVSRPSRWAASLPRRAASLWGREKCSERGEAGGRLPFPGSCRGALLLPLVIMGLSSGQQALISVGLVFCGFVVMPRMFGGGGGGGRYPRPAKVSTGRHDPQQQQHRHDGSERILQSHMNPGNSESKTYQSIQQMRNAMEKELKTERTRGNGKDLALTLMPLYAVGVGMFALYKFLKMKSQEESLSTREKITEDKTKETECQLLELEQHLAQTEKMLNSLLTQLDPLSSCINALASEQKDEIMVQLESIRKLMKESGLDKSAMKPQDISHACQEKLEDLIHSFSEHCEEEVGDGSDESFGHEVLFGENEEHCEEEKHEHTDHEFVLSPLEEPKEIEVCGVMNQDILEPAFGLRRRNK